MEEEEENHLHGGEITYNVCPPYLLHGSAFQSSPRPAAYCKCRKAKIKSRYVAPEERNSDVPGGPSV